MSISIIIPLYNKERHIAKTLTSVLSQSYQDFEIIIVDDGSTDNSVNEVQMFDDSRIRIIHQSNAGVSAARNRGITEAQNDLIVFLDADDLWEDTFLETILMLQHQYPQCSVLAVNYKILSSDGKITTPIINGLPDSFSSGIIENYFRIASQSDPIICSISLAVYKQAIASIGGFPVGIRAGEDLLTWAKLAARFDIAYSIEPKAIFNRTEEGINVLPRIPDGHDQVGEELRKLLTLKDTDRLDGLRDYIAYWHKIRMAIFLRLGKPAEAKKEFHKMAEFARKDLKFFVYAIVVHSPKWMRDFLNTSVLRMNTYRRKFLSSSGGAS